MNEAGAELIELQGGVANSEHDGGQQRRWVFDTKPTNVYLNSPRHFFFPLHLFHMQPFLHLFHMHCRGDLLASSESAELREIEK